MIQHTSFWSQTPHLQLYLQLSIVSVWSKSKSYQGELVSLEEEYLGMNISIKSSSKFKFSFYSYSNAYELEYSVHVIIMIYELVYSLYVMILTCSTTSLIIHIMDMSRIRARVEVAVHRAFGCAHILACQSIGLESQGIWVVSLYTGMVLGCTGTFGYDGIPWLRGRQHVVIALSIPCNPPCSGIVQES